jgi:hypothetical protein
MLFMNIFWTKFGENYLFKDNSFNSRDARRPAIRRMLFGVSPSYTYLPPTSLLYLPIHSPRASRLTQPVQLCRKLWNKRAFLLFCFLNT